MKIVLITGGSAGIGQAAAIEAAKAGFGVVVTYRGREAEAAETVRRIEEGGGSAAALHLDVADTGSFPGFVDRLTTTLQATWGTSRLHGLVNNAGVGGGAAFEDVTEEQFDHFHRVLFRGPYFLTQRLLPLLEDGGAIVNTGSTSALVTGVSPGYSAYASQKGAVHTLTHYWAKELSPRRIRVNAVAPGTTHTRIGDDAFAKMPELVTEAAAGIPFGRLGRPEDIGRVIAFLLGEGSGWVTGQVLEASGGQGL
jgi:NAD(P)-dependent dehydrogenase (short-subunit alcohol dehydrogenase family)